MEAAAGPPGDALSGDGEVSEADATGRLADAYAVIRAALDVPFVPTVYRMLARREELLVSAVGALEPLLAGGRAGRYAAAVRDRGGSAAARLPGGGLDAGDDGPELLALLERYNRANPLNLLFALALLPDEPAWTPAVMGPPPPRRPGLLADVLACHGGFTVPGVWRELAHLPGPARRAWELIRPLAGSAALAAARDDVIELARAELATVTVPTAEQLGYGEADIAAVRDTLAWFPHGIATMVIEIEYLRLRVEAGPEQMRSSA